MLVVSLPFAAHAGPYLHGALRADWSSFLPICLLLLILACPFLCENAPQEGTPAAYLRPAGGDPGLDHLQKYFFDSLCFLEWTWPF